jgi:hypothetical protein
LAPRTSRHESCRSFGRREARHLNGAYDLGAEEDDDHGVVGPEQDGEKGAEETLGEVGGRVS